jgi:hypothetical protein
MFKNKGKAAVVAGSSLAVLSIAGVAYAANLNLSSNQLGAGTATVAACDSSASIVATWTPNLTAGATTGVTDTPAGFVVRTVNITGIPAACTGTGKTVYVSVHNGAAVVGNGSISLPAGTTSVPVPLTVVAPATSVLAKDIVGINVLIP